MRKRILDLVDEKPLLDIAAYARKGRLPTPAERLHISLTVHRAPEVMVKVSGGARTLDGVERHMAYIGREGKLGLDVDTEGHVDGKGFERDLVREWDLDVDALQNHTKKSGSTRKPPKLVHNIIFSMPPGTSPGAVLKAVQRLAFNEWALEHRYAMALHTDDDHPHVHVVLKAMSEQGVRLNIRKATLRTWRAQFAGYLRESGVHANATERTVRGKTKTQMSDGIFRAALRGQSTFVARQRHPSAERNRSRIADADDRLRTVHATRLAISNGWRAAARFFYESGDPKLGKEIWTFRAQMLASRSDGQLLTGESPHHELKEPRAPHCRMM